ncbi:unnamed protein product [Musa banksii]
MIEWQIEMVKDYGEVKVRSCRSHWSPSTSQYQKQSNNMGCCSCGYQKLLGMEGAHACLELGGRWEAAMGFGLHH